MVAMFVCYVQQEHYLFWQHLYSASFQDPKVSGVIVTPTSQIGMCTMMLLVMQKK
jgi:hypothetical protein